ncbi:10475_t:CDS:2 [Cetraspora pellucida]|uniref:10475_t:CDS:1 n=1 Tax=Cetraspora pellucida TaxID=1433469 RepID=A0ACA9JX17_9GLOM|nr:10475_t:CDS:2 [Cetraspora pellucida]
MLPQKFAVLETDVNAHSMVDWYNFCQDICSLVLLNQETVKIRGQEKIVEIDKTSLPKYGTVKNLYDNYFSEYMWQRCFVQDDSNAFNMLVNHIVLYGKKLEHMICIPMEEH